MPTIVLPTSTTALTCEKTAIAPGFVMGTTIGLCKEQNEDRLGYRSIAAEKRICIADGHWGHQAAHDAVDFWLNVVGFPSNAAEARFQTDALETLLYEKQYRESDDPEKVFTPETSFIAATITSDELRFAAYGDCRLLVIRRGTIVYQYQTQPTWLGVLSRLGRRQRSSVASACTFASVAILPGDTILLFSDGVDECIYDTPTIPIEWFAEVSSRPATASLLFDNILQEVFTHGAEDNASLAVIQI